MPSNWLIGCLFAATMGISATLVQAQEVSIRHHGLTLNANLELAKDKLPADGVILITHAGLAHGGMEVIGHLQQQFKEHRYNTLAITLSLGLDDRRGMYDCKVTHRHHYADAADEIGAWVDWLKAQGVKHITLFGHSRGGAQTALFAAERDSPVVTAVVLLAPDTRATNDAIRYEQRHTKPLGPILDRAQQLVKNGQGDNVFEHTGILYCPNTSVSAGTIASYYGPDPRLDSPYLIPKIKKPTLILLAGSDEIVVGSKENFTPLAEAGRVRIQTIEGADHFFRDLYADEVAEASVAFLKSVGE